MNTSNTIKELLMTSECLMCSNQVRSKALIIMIHRLSRWRSLGISSQQQLVWVFDASNQCRQSHMFDVCTWSSAGLSTYIYVWRRWLCPCHWLTSIFWRDLSARLQRHYRTGFSIGGIAVTRSDSLRGMCGNRASVWYGGRSTQRVCFCVIEEHW